MSQYYPPTYKSNQFHCPYCGVFALQDWKSISAWHELMELKDVNLLRIEDVHVEISICSACDNGTLWLGEKIIYPLTGSAPPANSDLPDDIKQVYDEASAIADRSPRAACAMLRLAVEMLMKHLGETGNINESIGNLVKKGLDPTVQQSLDIVRITGNNAVHPGEIDFEDMTDVQPLFDLINVIAGVLITPRKHIQTLYNGLSEGAKKAIEERDGNLQIDDRQQTSTNPSSRRAKYKSYTQMLIDELREKHKFTGARTGQPDNWYEFSAGIRGVCYGVQFTRGNKVVTCVKIYEDVQSNRLDLFDALEQRKEEIESAFGSPLEWERLEEQQRSRIFVSRDGNIELPDDELERIREWHIANLLQFKAVFLPEIKRALETLN